MATLALKPALPMRTSSSGSKRDHRKPRMRSVLRSRPWQTIAITAGATALSFFSVLAPMIDDPTGRLLALDMTRTISAEEALGRDALAARAFEFTPTMLGPAITADMLALAELADEDAWVIIMPELQVRAVPPIEAEQSEPSG